MNLTPEEVDTALRGIFRDTLGVGADRVEAFTAQTPLFGALPELDSMAVANLLTDLEDRLGIIIDDDEVDGDMLEDYGGLLSFVTRKVAG
jgi:acyl carrier protein